MPREAEVAARRRRWRTAAARRWRPRPRRRAAPASMRSGASACTQAEAGGQVVGDDARRHAPAVAGDEVDLVGLEDEVADRQHQAVVADQDARALRARGRASRSSGHPRRRRPAGRRPRRWRAPAPPCAPRGGRGSRAPASPCRRAARQRPGAAAHSATAAARSARPAAPAATVARAVRTGGRPSDRAGFMRPPRCTRSMSRLHEACARQGYFPDARPSAPAERRLAAPVADHQQAAEHAAEVGEVGHAAS